MSEIAWRPAERADAEAIAAVFNAVAAQFDSRELRSAADVEQEFDRPTWNSSTDSRVAELDGEIVANGAVPPPPPGGERAWMPGAVHPAYQSRGIGRDLLRWQLDRLAAHRAERAADVPWVALAGMHADDKAADRLFRRHGLEPERHFFIMEQPVAAAVTDARPPAELRVVPFTADLERALYATHQEAFSDHWGFQARPFEHWLTSIRTEKFRPEQSRFAVTEGEEVAGFVLSFAGSDDSRMWLHSIGTRRAWRGKGVASGLIASTLEGFAAAGIKTALLDVDTVNPTGAVGIYERMGFTAAERSVAYSCAIR